MKIYLASPHTFQRFKDGKQLIASIIGGGFDKAIREHKPYILESFYYANEDTERLLPLFGDFMLDSGAFTFMQDKSSHCDWNEYVERYADFVKRNKIKKYFELDIDSVVGYPKVLEFRKRLEKMVGWPCIPVWHKNRGKDEFVSMVEKYDYAALGGIAGATIQERNRYRKFFPWFIKIAHQHNCKIHGLGFTSLEGLKNCHFDSVDSTAWTTGNRFGYIYHFDGETMQKTDSPEGHRIGDPRKAALINYVEWVKFQKYAEVHL